MYKERINKPFVIRCIPTYINEEKIKYLKDCGLAWITLGLQSGSDRVCRDIYNRKSLKADFLQAAEMIKQHNLAAFYDVILDNPFETTEDKLETVQTLMETPRPFYTQFFSLSLYLGTELYERAQSQCPEKIEDYRLKDYLRFRRDSLNTMIRLAAFRGKKSMQSIVRRYKRNPHCLKFHASLFLAKLLSLLIFEPLTCFRVIRLSQGNSSLKTLKVLPNYFAEGFMRYLNQFRSTG
jgi:radical SAM superfamily enzyme YgiQ (UPF0313 family)